MKDTRTYISILLKYLLPIYMVALVILTIFRGIFIAHFYDDFLLLYKTAADLHPILIKALVKGFRYDNIVLSYVISIPLIVLFVSWIIKISPTRLLTFCKVYLILLLSIVFALSCIDLPYFEYFWTHPTITIFDWIGFGGTFGMLVQESSYYPYFLLFIISIGIIITTSYFCTKWIKETTNKMSILSHRPIQLLIFLLSGVICFFGTRGHLSKTPIGLNAAYFTDNKLVSDLCVTPAYHFIAYLDDYKIDFAQLMPYDVALTNIQRQFNIDASNYAQDPLCREMIADSTRSALNLNIVLIFMESMGVNQLHQEENGKKLTPFLDSLVESSYYFENIYSSGVHTNAGVGSTLISMPSLLQEHMMTRNPMTYNSMLSELKKDGYSTSFFLPNEEVYDNMGLFLRANHIDTIFSDNHYPKEAKANNFGVPDDYLFNFAVNELNTISNQGKPFFSAILTVSNHPPYIVPEPFSSISENKEKSILAYVDYSINNFFKQASKQAWYNNTLFVLLGDHGKRSASQDYNMSLDYNHIPLIIYSPTFEDTPKRFTEYGGQIDILPTVMGILNKSYKNSTLGVDLLKDKRPCTTFTSDTYIGCINDEYFYILNPRDEREDLYQRNNNSPTNLDSIKQVMSSYALSSLSTASYINENNLGENN